MALQDFAFLLVNHGAQRTRSVPRKKKRQKSVIVLTMAPCKQLGLNVASSVLLQCIHPSECIRDKFPNPLPGQKLKGCVITGKDGCQICGCVQESILFCHPNFGNKELHCIKRWFKMTLEGPSTKCFDGEEATEAEGEKEPKISATINCIACMNVLP